MAFIRHIVVACAVDSPSSYAVRYAIELASILKTKLTILHVIDTSRVSELIKIGLFKENEKEKIEQDLEREGKMFVERFREIARLKGVECETIIIWGTVHKQVSRIISEVDADLLVIGGSPGICEGGTATTGEFILAEVQCPVLVVKKPRKDWSDVQK